MSEPTPKFLTPLASILNLNRARCRRCKHKWILRLMRLPRMCPKCKSVNWDQPRRKT